MKFKEIKGIESVVLSEKNNPVTKASRIAEFFGKRKADVMRSIRAIGDDVPEFSAKHFALIKEEVQAGNSKRKDPEYIMDETGFMFLVMGFSGKDAAELKVKFIEQFQSMKEYINKQNAPILSEASIQDELIIAASLSPQPIQQEVWYNGERDIRFDMVEKTTRSYTVYELKKNRLTQAHIFSKLESNYPGGIEALAGKRNKRFVFVAPAISPNARLLIRSLNETSEKGISYEFITVENMVSLIKSRISEGHEWFYDERFASLKILNEVITNQKAIKND